jgi:hypothetical protein
MLVFERLCLLLLLLLQTVPAQRASRLRGEPRELTDAERCEDLTDIVVNLPPAVPHYPGDVKVATLPKGYGSCTIQSAQCGGRALETGTLYITDKYVYSKPILLGHALAVYAETCGPTNSPSAECTFELQCDSVPSGKRRALWEEVSAQNAPAEVGAKDGRQLTWASKLNWANKVPSKLGCVRLTVSCAPRAYITVDQDVEVNNYVNCPETIYQHNTCEVECPSFAEVMAQIADLNCPSVDDFTAIFNALECPDVNQNVDVDCPDIDINTVVTSVTDAMAQQNVDCPAIVNEVLTTISSQFLTQITQLQCPDYSTMMADVTSLVSTVQCQDVVQTIDVDCPVVNVEAIVTTVTEAFAAQEVNCPAIVNDVMTSITTQFMSQITQLQCPDCTQVIEEATAMIAATQVSCPDVSNNIDMNCDVSAALLDVTNLLQQQEGDCQVMVSSLVDTIQGIVVDPQCPDCNCPAVTCPTCAGDFECNCPDCTCPATCNQACPDCNNNCPAISCPAPACNCDCHNTQEQTGTANPTANPTNTNTSGAIDQRPFILGESAGITAGGAVGGSGAGGGNGNSLIKSCHGAHEVARCECECGYVHNAVGDCVANPCSSPHRSKFVIDWHSERLYRCDCDEGYAPDSVYPEVCVPLGCQYCGGNAICSREEACSDAEAITCLACPPGEVRNPFTNTCVVSGCQDGVCSEDNATEKLGFTKCESSFAVVPFVALNEVAPHVCTCDDSVDQPLCMKQTCPACKGYGKTCLGDGNCVCKVGLVQRPDCDDCVENPCALNPCGLNEVCSVLFTKGGRALSTCSCAPGYGKDFYGVCVPENCDTCAQNEQCSQTGCVECAPPGITNPYTNECLDGDLCPAGACTPPLSKCQVFFSANEARPGSSDKVARRGCVCDETVDTNEFFFDIDLQTVRAKNECELESCGDCGANSVCTRLSGESAPQCVCKQGYTLAPDGNCVQDPCLSTLEGARCSSAGLSCEVEFVRDNELVDICDDQYHPLHSSCAFRYKSLPRCICPAGLVEDPVSNTCVDPKWLKSQCSALKEVFNAAATDPSQRCTGCPFEAPIFLPGFVDETTSTYGQCVESKCNGGVTCAVNEQCVDRLPGSLHTPSILDSAAIIAPRAAVAIQDEVFTECICAEPFRRDGDGTCRLPCDCNIASRDECNAECSAAATDVSFSDGAPSCTGGTVVCKAL